MTFHPQYYGVYHANDPWAIIQPSEQRWQMNNAFHYKHVAEVYAQLERVFALTNHSEEENWTSHWEVVWHATEGSMRSTSVGDVILSRATGKAWLIMPFELKEISGPTLTFPHPAHSSEVTTM